MNPQQIIQQILSKNNNPVINNLVDMINKGDTKSVEQFARNFCKERNVDFDTEFKKFRSQFK